MKKNQQKHIPPVTVEQSAIHGKGLFASRDIKKGELIAAFKYKQAKKMPPTGYDLKKIKAIPMTYENA
ncbi:MAG: hypothetical protein LC437_05795 [Thiohalomonas sp.]|nr:hypothetical protein [Thiohalomonas sp.]